MSFCELKGLAHLSLNIPSTPKAEKMLFLYQWPQMAAQSCVAFSILLWSLHTWGC